MEFSYFFHSFLFLTGFCRVFIGSYRISLMYYLVFLVKSFHSFFFFLFYRVLHTLSALFQSFFCGFSVFLKDFWTLLAFLKGLRT